MVSEPLDKINKHGDAFLWVNDLIIDLKLQLAGMEPTAPITTERLEEWRRHGREIQDCMRDVRKRY